MQNGESRSSKPVHFPASSSLDSLALLFWSLTYIQRKMNRYAAKRASDGGTLTLSGEGPLCIDHDLVCSSFFGLPSKWPWTGDLRKLQFWAPCVGSFEVDVEGCCYNHDICLWCAPNRWKALSCASLVVDCMYQAVCDAAVARVWDLPYPYVTVPICLPLVLAWLLGPVQALFDIGLIGELIVSAASRREFVGRGFDEDSCLCGGRNTTLMCSQPCRNLCQETRHPARDCYWCTWKCQYDRAGNRLPPRLQTDPSGKLPCCLGSAGTTGSDGTECSTAEDAQMSCPTCVSCPCTCRNTRAGRTWFIDNSESKASGIKCCKNPQPCPPPNARDPRFSCPQ